MKNKLAVFLSIAIILLVVAGVAVNVQKQLSVDRSRLPQKIALSRGFDKWITNLKNHGFIIEGDEFKLKEDDEIYNTKWIKVYSLDQPGMQQQLDDTLAAHKDLNHVEFSPSGRLFIDYRDMPRDGYMANEARLYGELEDKILDARILDCSVRANCLFDRAYFLENDVFVIHELSRTIDKKDEVAPLCSADQECEYSFKVHEIDLKNNKRYVYESKPFKAILNKIKSEV